MTNTNSSYINGNNNANFGTINPYKTPKRIKSDYQFAI